MAAAPASWPSRRRRRKFEQWSWFDHDVRACLSYRFRATPKGRKAMASAKVKVRELFSELLEDEHLENGLAESGLAAPRDLMKGLVSELRAGAREAQEPKAQALLETSAAVIGGLIKAFDAVTYCSPFFEPIWSIDGAG
jgi:hypothetical protein